MENPQQLSQSSSSLAVGIPRLGPKKMVLKLIQAVSDQSQNLNLIDCDRSLRKSVRDCTGSPVLRVELKNAIAWSSYSFSPHSQSVSLPEWNFVMNSMSAVIIRGLVVQTHFLSALTPSFSWHGVSGIYLLISPQSSSTHCCVRFPFGVDSKSVPP